MAWLSGWDKRIELAINDYAGDIGGSVTWFPSTIHLKNTNGGSTKVFLEVGNNYKKIAITKADGTTELYGEVEKWSYDSETPANSTGVIHTSAEGWVINDNTSVYLYYDNDHVDNITYIGIKGLAGRDGPRENVWDGNYKMVQHGDDETTSTITDSTSNNNDGTKKGVNEPLEVAGKVGQAQDFDGVDDYIEIANSATLDGTTGTLECIIKQDNALTYSHIMGRSEASQSFSGIWFYSTATVMLFNIKSASAQVLQIACSTDTNDNAYHHIAGVFVPNGQTGRIYVDGTQENSAVVSAAWSFAGDVMRIGHDIGTYWEHYPDLIDETRWSSVERTAAWIKGTYNSLFDTLFTYGEEETLVNALFFGSNF